MAEWFKHQLHSYTFFYIYLELLKEFPPAKKQNNLFVIILKEKVNEMLNAIKDDLFNLFKMWASD